ncbi:hypothetical protein TNCV_1877101 [Trichonephila clavipes]|nr:hypothetical protein TNCV_1877101 [Trichonephila clavipes]
MRISPLTDLLTGTSALAPQRPRPRKLRWTQQETSIDLASHAQQQPQLSFALVTDYNVMRERWNGPESYTQESHASVCPITVMGTSAVRSTFNPAAFAESSITRQHDILI